MRGARLGETRPSFAIVGMNFTGFKPQPWAKIILEWRILLVAGVLGQSWGSLFELGDLHVIDHVTTHGPSCGSLLGPQSPLVPSS